MFWGLVLEPSRSYAQVVETPFHVSMATLDLKNADNQEDASTLVLRQDNTEFVLANLSKKHKIFNTPLSLDFDVGEEIEFFVQGQSQIHLTGFLVHDENDDMDETMDEEEVVEKLKDIKKAEAAKRKLKDNSSGPVKKQKILDESFNDDTDEDDFDIDEDDLDDLEEEEDSDLEEDSNDDDEDDDEEDEDEDMSDEVSSPAKKEQKPQQQQKQANNVQSPESKKQKKKQKKQKKLEKQQQANKQGNQQQQGNKQANQQQQGNKQANQQQKNHVNQSKTPQKNQQPNKTPQKTPQAKTPQPKTPQTGNKQQNAKSPQGNGEPSKRHKKVLKGGIVVEDIVEGSGKVASSSKKVGVYYVGRLASNKKVFDQTTSGKPFGFNLGRGEVIRGWDLGLEGMREGGKRKITIPAKFAYGSDGAPPAIPPNSTLEFEVTLMNVK